MSDLGLTTSIDVDRFDQLSRRIPTEVMFGTSTWNYPGWQGLVYHKDYGSRGAAARMLEEYAAFPLFRTVGIDSSFYAPPTEEVLRGYAERLPPEFPCVSKVWNQVTVQTFAKALGRHTGIGPEEFARRLDEFFTALPREGQYAVEVRNEEFLTPMYFAVLREHGVAHVFSSWTRMPAIGDQMDLPGSLTASFIVARALLRPGRSYDEAVDAFAPYDRIQAPTPELRRDLPRLVETAVRTRIPAYLLVNNRAEGSAPHTIAEVARLLPE